MKSYTEIKTLHGDDEFLAYTSQPISQPKAAIIVIQEIFGVNDGIRIKCDQWAEQGYLAVAPDLFWRIRPGIELDPDTPDQMQEGLKLFGQFDQEAAIRDIEATIRDTRAMIDGGKVGAVGYCLGGRLAYMTAARTDINASVGYYGVGLDGLLGEAHAIAHPLLLHIAGNDGFVPPDVQKKMHEGLDGHPKVTLFDYPGVDHGFATTMGNRRVEEAATLADRRTQTFFAEHLA
ncbi:MULTISPECIES: dienelactone hydrolase family protein [unclassified Sphingomonas]|uniref:dienelactone hydrolase family protein n=1 Tax=unclassified Sphingomonas TaxID=196159 RepID=UPI0006F522BE|nr:MULTISPECIES: dienelactone hydrolase family protein [unclassified Sphingomonas]KQX21525.1 carboxymethylenebutenolidase [Sphingomonas sp. Root1294]KQY72842.1 carboxymethylenebutenolidase [Sphingomonas sp. Root50]KRB88364.1 carboxymethylenebutenolidase [Sphingomonas sp. Root720]